MNRDKRQFVHEYCAHFGLESVSYDAEPKRNVVATAFRDKIWLPSQSIVDVATKQRSRAPAPMMTVLGQNGASANSRYRLACIIVQCVQTLKHFAL